MTTRCCTALTRADVAQLLVEARLPALGTGPVVECRGARRRDPRLLQDEFIVLVGIEQVWATAADLGLQ